VYDADRKVIGAQVRSLLYDVYPRAIQSIASVAAVIAVLMSHDDGRQPWGTDTNSYPCSTDANEFVTQQHRQIDQSMQSGLLSSTLTSFESQSISQTTIIIIYFFEYHTIVLMSQRESNRIPVVTSSSDMTHSTRSLRREIEDRPAVHGAATRLGLVVSTLLPGWLVPSTRPSATRPRKMGATTTTTMSAAAATAA